MSAVVSFTAYAAATSFFVAMRSRDQSVMRKKQLEQSRSAFTRARQRRLEQRQAVYRVNPNGSNRYH